MRMLRPLLTTFVLAVPIVASVAAPTTAATPSTAPIVAPGTATGPCTASLNGIDVTTLASADPDSAIHLADNGVITLAVTSPQPMSSYSVELAFAGLHWTVAHGVANGTTWSRTVNVGSYSKYGVGLYQLHVTSASSTPCAATVLVNVSGSPFGSVAGWAAIVFVALGLGGSVMAVRRRLRRVPVGYILLGGVGGIGAIIGAQEFALAFPTGTFAIVGLGVGLVVPTSLYMFSHFAGAGAGASGAGAGSLGTPPLGTPPPPPPAPPPPAGVAGVGGGGPVTQHVPTTSLNPSVAPGHGNLAPSAHATHGLESAPTTHVPSSTELGANTHLPHGLEAGSNANLLHGPELGLDPNLALQHVVGGFSIVPALVVVGSAGVLSWGGPDPAALPGPPLAPGVQLNVLDQVGDRVFVECPDGTRTWVAAADVGREPPERT